MPDDTAFLLRHTSRSSLDGINLMGTQYLLDTAVVQHAIAEKEHEVLLIKEHSVRFLLCEHITQFGSVTFPLTPEL